MALEKAAQAMFYQFPAAGVAVTLALALCLSLLLKLRASSKSLPIINGRKLFEFSDKGLKDRYRTNAKELLEYGLQQVS